MRALLLSALLLAIPAVAHADRYTPKIRHGHLKAAGRTEVPRHTVARRRSGVVYFTPRRVQVIREYYGPRDRALPPGLQKKLYRTGTLPPGWQKKIEPLPVVVERRLGPAPGYYRRGIIDNYAVVYDPRTYVIIDVTPIW